jgi:streptogramin lyase
MWFIEDLSNSIGEITPSGVITEWPVPNVGSSADGIALGSDKNMWFAERYGNKIAKITPSGVITEWPVPNANVDTAKQEGGLGRIALGGDGDIWFTYENRNSGGFVGKVTPAGVFTEFKIPVDRNNLFLGALASGGADSMWFVKSTSTGNKIVKITPSGSMIEYREPDDRSSVGSMVLGPDKNMWLSEGGSDIYKITPSGGFTKYSASVSNSNYPSGIVVGPDGNLYATNSTNIERITLNGLFTQFPISLPAETGLTSPSDLAFAKDGSVWFTTGLGGAIGRLDLKAAKAKPTCGATPSPRATVKPPKTHSSDFRWIVLVALLLIVVGLVIRFRKRIEQAIRRQQ